VGIHRLNAGFTFLAPLKVDCVAATSELLAQLHAEQARLPFARSSTTHFATITVIPEQTYCGERLPAMLLLATSFSGPTRAHVAEVVRLMGDGLREVLQHCEGFDAGCSSEDLEEFLIDRRKPDTFYSGMQHLSPECVRRHRELRDAIQAYIDERQERGDLRGSAGEIRREIQDYVRSRADLAWAQEPFKPTFSTWLAFYWRQLVVEGLVGALVVCTVAQLFVHSPALGVIVACGWIAVAAFLLFVVILVASVREAEPEQAYVSARPSDERARMLAATQTRPVINEFTLGGPIKPEGVLRPTFLRLSLWVIARVAEGVPGIPYLSAGINIPTVATARWIVADRGRRLLFISNYTNEGKAYVRDFIETRIGAMRINLTFGFGTGYPPTEWIIGRGALDDPNAYLHSLCENQLPTLFWYGPYRDISIDNIRVNRRIREGLFGDCTEREAQDWLHLL
jgi:hypothetical protein